MSSSTTEQSYGPPADLLINRLTLRHGVSRETADGLPSYIAPRTKHDARRVMSMTGEVESARGFCAVCFNSMENDGCDDCSGSHCVRPTVVHAETRRGHVWGESGDVLSKNVSSVAGASAEFLKIVEQIQPICLDGVEELVIATNPTLEGDETALFVTKRRENDSVKITRLAAEVVSSSVLEFANRETLASQPIVYQAS